MSGLLCMTMSAQETKAKRPASEYLPKAGDFAISVSADPFTSFIGNMLNNSLTNGINSFGGDPYLIDGNPNTLRNTISISGKYMLTDNLGVRVNLGWIHDADTRNFYVQDDAALAANPLSQQNVVDSYMTRSSGGSFSAAVEYRVGKGRVQGVFGGGLLYAFSYDRSKYEYGNAITSMNQQPTVSNDMTGAIMRNDIPDGFSYMRYLSKFGDTPTNYFGLVAFAGIEWFVAPRISLGGEVNLAAVFNWTKATYYTAEGFNTVSGAPETWTELLSPKSTGFHFGTGNIGQNISVTFYF